VSRPISDVEVDADVEIERDVFVVVLMVCSIGARTWAAYFHYRAWTPQWLTFFKSNGNTVQVCLFKNTTCFWHAGGRKHPSVGF
jgi:hypothetical protein